MSEEIWLDVMGLTAKVVLDDEDLANEVRRAWSACLLDPTDADPDFTIEPEATPVVKVRVASRASKPPDSPEMRLERITQTLTVTAIEQLAGKHLMLHACAVAKDDKCVVFVGPSGMGKTTVARILGRRWAYVTDECVVIDADGSVRPFPKPLSIAGESSVKSQQAPSDLGLSVSDHSTKPDALFLLRRDPAVDESTVEAVSTVQAVALLGEHVSYLAHLERPLSHVAGLVHAVGELRVVTYADATQLEPLVEAAFGDAP